ncbi:MAG TPA: GAF domain-containing protein [Candidatus Eisenbacteria bacterium]|jgi:transcriptional regulator with GAF, ATPase, and Fis domain
MSKFDLRDISQRLSASKDTEALVLEFLGYLESVRPDWRAALAFYEVSQDALVSVYQRISRRLARKDLNLPVDQLPARLVRKFFHPSAFFNHGSRRALLSHLLQTSPHYEVPPVEAQALRAISPLSQWESCVCLPLADQEDLLGILVLASEHRNAFPSRAIGEILPIRAIATLALSQHLHRSGRVRPTSGEDSPDRAADEFQARIKRIDVQAEQLAHTDPAEAERLDALMHELETLDATSNQYKQEVERVKAKLLALEEQSVAATQHLTDAYAQLDLATGRLYAMQRTVGFMKEVCQVLSQEHDRQKFARTLVSWFCEHFSVERCSLMLLDDARETLAIAAQRGIDPEVASRVKVRIGQGIAGWVAHNRKPLFIRVREDAKDVSHTGQDSYNSDSFICVPLIYNNRLCGVMNLSNKRNGEPFEDYDLDRAQIAGSLLAVAFADLDQSRRAAAWA